MKNIKIEALAQFLERSTDEVKESSFSSNSFECNNAKYLTLTESERDDTVNEYLEQYLDNILDMNKHTLGDLVYYIDHEKWIKDALFDGAGHYLANYDGNEIEEVINGEYIYIYRTH